MPDRIFYDEHKQFKFDFSNAEFADENDKCGDKKYNIKGFFLADFLIETQKSFIFIEFKNLEHPNTKDTSRQNFLNDIVGANKKSSVPFIEIARDFAFEISCKFKDTFLLKWAQDMQFNKPIHYVFILNAKIDPKNTITFMDRVEGLLPLNITKHQHIKKEVISSFSIVDINGWNERMGQFPITKIQEANT